MSKTMMLSKITGCLLSKNVNSNELKKDNNNNKVHLQNLNSTHHCKYTLSCQRNKPISSIIRQLSR